LEESGLASAAQWYLDGFAARSHIKIQFDKGPAFPRLSRALELALFRILQEALTNVHRHSGSRTARVRLFVTDSAAVLEISDQGKGIAPEILEQVRNEGALGIGLRGMTERMHQLGGRLRVESSPQQGTVVTAIAPISGDAVSSRRERSA
jgi:signal transduction histidine kinase